MFGIALMYPKLSKQSNSGAESSISHAINELYSCYDELKQLPSPLATNSLPSCREKKRESTDEEVYKAVPSTTK
jgi:hypothetical protein